MGGAIEMSVGAGVLDCIVAATSGQREDESGQADDQTGRSTRRAERAETSDTELLEGRDGE